MLSCFFRTPCRWCILITGCWGVEAVCLQNASQEQRILFNRETGETYPIGLWHTSDYPAARLATQVVQILVEERLGYRTLLKGSGRLAQDAFYALAGCTSPLDGIERGCSETSVTYVHVNVDAWRLGYELEWQKVQARYPQLAPKNLGSMGYEGFSSSFVPSNVQQKAYAAEGLNLDFFREYNVSWRSPGRFFNQPGDLNVSKLLPCKETALMTSDFMSLYVRWSGDLAGVVTDSSGTVAGKCFDDYFWYAPGCRSDPSTCLVWLTGGNGWGVGETMQRAAAYNMPLAAAVASSFKNYAELPLVHDMLLYWWVPDTTFLRLAPQRITFPAYHAEDFWEGNYRTATPGMPIEKLVSQDLYHLAPEVEEVLRRLTMSLQALEGTMLDQINTADSDSDVACRWLRANEEIWKTWFPARGSCSIQFGMYSEKTKTFLTARDEDVTISCRICPSGTASKQFPDDEGTTYVCRECETGHFQASGGQELCDPCPAGTYQNETGSIACKRCPFGQYQDAAGSSQCKRCVAGSTTPFLGATSLSDCGCEEGSINVNASREAPKCIPCGKGLACPFSSSLEALQSGQSFEGEAVPQIVAGYFATFEEPLQILRCRPDAWCPGGTPGTCAGGLIGHPCSVCPDGQAWVDERCEDCQFSIVPWLGGVVLALLAIRAGYFLANLTVTAQAKPFKVCLMAGGLIVHSLQMLALLGLMSVKWPGSFDATSPRLQFFLLDMEDLRLSCPLGRRPVTRYLVTVSAFPVALLWLALCHVLSKCSCLQKWVKAWKLAFTLNTMGLGFQLGFGAISSVALKPAMCYEHPNGRESLANYPSIFCGESDHLTMLCCGVVLLVVFVLGFLVLCAHATWNLPSWSVQGYYHKVQSFRFFTSNFRFDAYWFILPQLLKSLGFALSATLGTQYPPAQTGVAVIVLMLYMTLQAVVHPWKAPVINIADTTLNALLLLAATKSIPTDVNIEAEFANYFMIVILLAILLCISLLLVFCVMGLLLHLTGRDWRWLSRDNLDPEVISDALENCADILLDINSPDLGNQIAGLNHYDVRTVLNFIILVSELSSDYGTIPSDSIRSHVSRVAFGAINRSLTARASRTKRPSGEERRQADRDSKGSVARSTGSDAYAGIGIDFENGRCSIRSQVTPVLPVFELDEISTFRLSL